MTAATEFTRCRLTGSNRARFGLVLVRRLVAGEAGQAGVVRYRLLARYLAVTRPALARGHGRFRRVRVVARHARDRGVVGHGVDLGEARGPRCVVAVAQRTEPSLPRRRRLYGPGSSCVFRRRPVAHLA